MPTNAYDAKGLHGLGRPGRQPGRLHRAQAAARRQGRRCPRSSTTCPSARRAVRREGDDVTVVAIGRMVNEALDAAEQLAAEGIEMRGHRPPHAAAAGHRRRSSSRSGGPTGCWWCTRPCASAASAPRSPPRSRRRPSTTSTRRSGGSAPRSRPVPFSPALEKHYVPNRKTIAAAVRGAGAPPGARSLSPAVDSDLLMPKFGLTMTEGTIVAWQVEPGWPSPPATSCSW